MSDVELAEAAAANKKSGLRFQKPLCVFLILRVKCRKMRVFQGFPHISRHFPHVVCRN
jgi:hypothetical protein